MPIAMVAMPNTALTLALCPMVKKWCSQTVKESMAMDIVAITSEMYPYSSFDEKAEMTSE